MESRSGGFVVVASNGCLLLREVLFAVRSVKTTKN